MTFSILTNSILFAMVAALAACSTAPPVTDPGVPLSGGDFRALMKPVPANAMLTEDGWEVWGGSMVRGDDGLYHLFYAKWPSTTGHAGWLSDSVIARATASDPLGPYEPQGIVLAGSGGAQWDAEMTHNPTVKKFGGKYYLFYIGTRKTEEFDDYRGKGVFADVEHQLPDDRVNLRVNQRIGVAVADSVEGPWKRSEMPLVDAVPGTIRHYFAVNPSVTETPERDYLLVYKCMDPEGRVVHGVARASRPEGPYRHYPDPVFTAEGEAFAAEDPFVWWQDGFYYAILKDFRGVFTGRGLSLALFFSADGVEWSPAADPFLTQPVIHRESGETEEVRRLERPQLWLDAGRPAVLFCAALPRDTRSSFNVHIPLR